MKKLMLAGVLLFMDLLAIRPFVRPPQDNMAYVDWYEINRHDNKTRLLISVRRTSPAESKTCYLYKEENPELFSHYLRSLEKAMDTVQFVQQSGGHHVSGSWYAKSDRYYLMYYDIFINGKSGHNGGELPSGKITSFRMRKEIDTQFWTRAVGDGWDDGDEPLRQPLAK